MPRSFVYFRMSSSLLVSVRLPEPEPLAPLSPPHFHLQRVYSGLRGIAFLLHVGSIVNAALARSHRGRRAGI